MSKSSSVVIFEAIRTPAIAFLTTLAAFVAYRQQAEGFMAPPDDSQGRTPDPTATDTTYDVGISHPQGQITRPETQALFDFAELHARDFAELNAGFNQTLRDRPNQAVLNQQAAELNATIEDIRQRRQPSSPLRPLPAYPVATAPLSAAATPPQARQTEPIPSATTPHHGQPIHQAAPPNPAQGLNHPEGDVSPVNAGAADLTTVAPRGYTIHRPDIPPQQPQFSPHTFSSHPVEDTPVLPPSEHPGQAMPSTSTPAIAAQVPSHELATAAPVPTAATVAPTPAIAGRYRFREDLQVPPPAILNADNLNADNLNADSPHISPLPAPASQTCPRLTASGSPLVAPVAPADQGAPTDQGAPADQGAPERPQDISLSSSTAVCAGETNVLAQRIPDAATAGTPMPGNVLSPTR